MSTVDSANKSRVGEVLLRVEDLIVEYKGSRSGAVQAVAGVSFEIKSGETVAVVGESGCGKSSLAKGVMQLVETKSGKVVLDGTEFSSLKGEELRRARPKMQMIFQDSVASLDPHLTVRALVEQPMKVWHKGTEAERKAKVDELLRSVNLDPEIVGNRKPTEFSGGQCQRVSIARALSLEPKLLVCDRFAHRRRHHGCSFSRQIIRNCCRKKISHTDIPHFVMRAELASSFTDEAGTQRIKQ